MPLLGELSAAAGRFGGLGSRIKERNHHKLNTNIICLFKEGFGDSYAILLNV